MKSIYLEHVLDQIPQILANQDRDPLSPSYGSFDRKYWGWKYKDFSDATLQCALSPLIQVWNLDVPDNPYYHHPALFEWIAAGVDFLFKIQHADGGFDQCYPNESAPGNAYELFEPVLFFLEAAQGRILGNKAASLRDKLRKACELTLSRDEDHGNIANHFALYSYASFKMGRLLGDERFEKKGLRLLEKALSLQSPEGWFLEYDGADPGYETRTLYYLSKIAVEFGRDDLFEPISKSLKDFLVFCLHPDGSMGGEYGARNTVLCYPAGFEILSARFPEAASIAKGVRHGLETKAVLSLDALDPDNLMRLAANYLEADRFSKQSPSADASPPCQQENLERFLPQAGLFFKSTPFYYLVLNAYKGGTFRLYDKKSEKLLLSDTSYGASTKDGSILSTNLLVPEASVSVGERKVEIKTSFHKVLQQNMTPFRMIGLRLACLTFLKIGFLSRLFSRYVAGVLFKERKRFPFMLQRSFALEEGSIRITDVIDNGHGLKEIHGTSFSTSVHMASSKYFCLGDLPVLTPARTGGLLVKTVIALEGGTWRIGRSS